MGAQRRIDDWLEAPLFTQWSMGVLSKEELGSDETRIKTNITHIAPLDYQKVGYMMLNDLKRAIQLGGSTAA